MVISGHALQRWPRRRRAEIPAVDCAVEGESGYRGRSDRDLHVCVLIACVARCVTAGEVGTNDASLLADWDFGVPRRLLDGLALPAPEPHAE